MYNYLHGLPFQTNQTSSANCSCGGQGFDPAEFKLYAEVNRFPTFALRLPPMGENPDLTYAAECIWVYSCDGEVLVSVTMENAGVRIFKDGASYYLIYEGGPVSGLKMDCGKCYRIKIMSYWSEPFWITDTPQNKVLITFSSKTALGDVPYQPPLNFVQKLLLDGEICSVAAEFFENSKADSTGNITTTYQRLTTRKKLVIYNAPEFITDLVGSLKMHSSYTVSQNAVTYSPIVNRTEVTTDAINCCYSDLSIIMPLRDSKIIGGVCQAESDGTLTEVDIPDGLPNSCEVVDDWTDTTETKCLPMYSMPPDILPPITPVGTPPVGAPCPPLNFVISRNTQTTTCADPFVSGGIQYKKRVVKQIADGECGTTEEIDYFEPCGNEVTAHTISNINCQGDVMPAPPVGTPPVGTPPVGTPPVGTPPVGTPPVGTPPVGTPPVGTPPVGTPPVGTPPVGTPPPAAGEVYELMMGTTGSGFDKDASNGIQPEWIQRFESCNYSWGWGITGISLWIYWADYEPTPGNYQSAALQRAVAYCSARNLSLGVVFIAKRKQGDGFVNSSEIVKGSNGTLFIEGPEGFGDVYAGYGCDRVNALMVGAIQSIANTIKGYSKAKYVAFGGAHSGELVNHIITSGAFWEFGDFSDDNLSRFQQWVTPRGLASYGTVPRIQGVGMQWPYPNFSTELGKEFGRYLTFNIAKYYRNGCNAVKAVAPNLPCLNLYAAASNLQLRCTSNAAMKYIGQWGNGMYGSDGDGLYDNIAKIRCNSVNLGTFPNGISAVEYDPGDLSTHYHDYGTMPDYGKANPQWQNFLQYAQLLYSKGAQIIHFAMAFSPGELANASGALQQLSQSHLNKAYVRPVINSTNRIDCEVTTPYRASEDILNYYGVDVNTRYANYTHNEYWGGVEPVMP